MPNFNEFLKNEMTEMIIGAMAEAVQKETSLKANTDVEAKVKIPMEPLIKKAAERMGEEDCKAAEEFAASLYYTYSSFIAVGFSVAQAFELIKCVLKD